MYAAIFVLIDPTRYQQYRDCNEAIVRRAYASIQGSFDDIAILDDPRLRAQIVDHNIIELTHFKNRWRRMQRDSSSLLDINGFYYCSLCGRPFPNNNECRRCRISFASDNREDTVAGRRIPFLPARVQRYFEEEQKHRFAHRPPRV